MEETEVIASELVEAREATSVVFQLANETFDEVAFFVKLRVIRAGVFAI